MISPAPRIRPLPFGRRIALLAVSAAMPLAPAVAQIKTDPHSPAQYRANGTLKNQPGFYEAFKVKAGDKMYLAPKDRVIIW